MYKETAKQVLDFIQKVQAVSMLLRKWLQC